MALPISVKPIDEDDIESLLIGLKKLIACCSHRTAPEWTYFDLRRQWDGVERIIRIASNL
jgi:hypothetical protein